MSVGSRINSGKNYSEDFEKDLSKLSLNDLVNLNKAREIVDIHIENVNNDLDEKNVIDNKWRSQDYKPSEAEALLNIAKTQKIGEVFKYGGRESKDLVKVGEEPYTRHDKILIVTPYNTVVSANVYIESLQESLLAYHNENIKFTSLSFFDLINLAFKRLFKKG